MVDAVVGDSQVRMLVVFDWNASVSPPLVARRISRQKTYCGDSLGVDRRAAVA